ncbi:biotin transporter BioY [uncultured Tateyamaria sp.]|uniref:biotin transporter BioY n=1 Tax=uncultured Tateyamaria sp. TaxID=455651 RepID=UPI00261AE458|nr:biotin transporter BioY [uncultured Tateyamaria sp.]
MSLSPSPNAVGSPIGMGQMSSLWQLVFVICGTLFLALSSYIEVPMIPVPVTMQTFAVTLIGALFGWRLGVATIVAWLGQGALGLPVLAGGAAGAHHFIGPTGGYLFAFVLAGALTGWLVERGWNGHRLGLAFAAMLAGNALCLVVGAAWLAVLIGVGPAITNGVIPFVVGGVLKSALGAMVLYWVAQRVKRAPGP